MILLLRVDDASVVLLGAKVHFKSANICSRGTRPRPRPCYQVLRCCSIELPYKRPRTFVSGQASIAAVETSKHRLSRDFQRRSIFDFCNSIGTLRTWRDVRLESVIG